VQTTSRDPREELPNARPKDGGDSGDGGADGVIERVNGPAGELTLRRRRGELEILVDGMFLMSTACRDSERALASRALARITSHDGLRVLIGGLGAGHTLAATLEDPRVARVDVAEIHPTVIDWFRRYLAPCELDPRCTLEPVDVMRPMAERPATWDAILLDVDNGPGWLSRKENEALYRTDGLAVALRALRPGGVVAIWSAQDEPALAEAALAASAASRVGVHVEHHAIAVVLADAGDRRASEDHLYLMTAAAAAPAAAASSERVAPT
jgi:spermidine synthase